VEINPRAAATLRSCPFIDDDAAVIEGDIRQVDWSKYGPAHPDRADGTPLIFWSSFPCQCWSSAGSRKGGRDTERNGWPWTVDVIDKARPDWLICENVPGLLQHSKKAHRRAATMRAKLARLGYPTTEADDDLNLDCPGCYFEHVILADLRQRFAHVGYAQLNAADYGTPQRRNRVIIVAGPSPFDWPTPTHSIEALVAAKWVTGTYWRDLGLEPIGTPSKAEVAVLADFEQAHLIPPASWSRKPWVTVRQAIAGVIDEARPEGTSPPGKDKRHPDNPPDYPATAIRSGGQGHSAPPLWMLESSSKTRTDRQGEPRGPLLYTNDEPALTIDSRYVNVRVIGPGTNPHGKDREEERREADLTDTPAKTISATRQNNQHHYIEVSAAAGRGLSQWQRTLDPDAPATTVDAGGVTGGGRAPAIEEAEDTSPYVSRRRLSPRECAALQSFPADHPFQGTKTSIYTQVGNAVPPPLAEAVARAVLAAIEEARR